MREIQAAPEGYGVPNIVADLVKHAEAHGWRTLVQWSSACDDAPFLRVEVARKADGLHRWHYQLTWHSRGCAPGKLRRFRSGIAATPDIPRWHDAPSVKKIRAVIETNPC